MAKTQILLIFAIIAFIGFTQGCKPWNTKCQSDGECCYRFCYRGTNRTTGVCRKREGQTFLNGTGPSIRAETKAGTCSWYGADGEIPPGARTACGNVFNRNDMTAAHPTILGSRCGARVRVTNLDNGKSVIVAVNDKGPNGRPGRIMDLSYAAFGKIEDRNKGLCRCSYEVL